jgi:site-specific recombinase XerC
MAATGLRLSSALALDVEDLDLDRGEVQVRRVKGGGEQMVFLADAVRDRLRDHVGERLSGPLFLGRGGSRLGHRQAQRRFADWVQKARLRGGISPHSLRHGFALSLYERTGDLLLVQAALGHASITSTTVYAQASQERVRAAVLAG